MTLKAACILGGIAMTVIMVSGFLNQDYPVISRSCSPSLAAGYKER